MAKTRMLQRSFAGGEISPEMLGRIDDPAYQAGLALCKNFIVKPQGPVENRPGFAFVKATKSSGAARLIPFTYSTDQTMVIEMGDEYFRFHTDGGTVLYTAGAAYGAGTPYTPSDKVVYSGVNYECIQAGTGHQPDTSPTYWYALPSDLTYEIESPYAVADIFEVHYVQSGDVMTLVHRGYDTITLNRGGAEYWCTEDIDFAAPVLPPAAAPTIASAGPGVGSGYTNYYVVTSVLADGSESEKSSTSIGMVANLFTSGTYNTISWLAAPGTPPRYRVYKLQGGIFGIIGESTASALSIIDDNIAADTSVTPPRYDVQIKGLAGQRPGAVGYFEQRKCFASSDDEPQTMWMTKSGTENTMSYSLPVRDDDRIELQIAARQANTIRHIVPLEKLFLLTSSTEYRLESIDSGALTPSSVAVHPQSYIGASDVTPVTVAMAIVFEAARGGHIQELAYRWQASSYSTGDLSLRAAHLFDNFTVIDMAYGKAPQSIIWVVSSSGALLGFTYLPEQKIGAWHQHDTTDGVYESCAVVAEGNEDVLYVVVKRLLPDGNYYRYIERLASRQFTDQEDAFFVDSGLTYDGTNTTTAHKMTLTTVTTWALGEVLTLTASGGHTPFAAGDVDDAIVITDAAGVEYTLTITSYTSSTVVSAITDRAIPVALQAAATDDWAFARLDVSGLSHLEGETVNVLADGAVRVQCVVASGAITLATPAVVIQAGLPIVADLQTLPMFFASAAAFGQGRVKNVNSATVRVYRSSGLWVGPDVDHLIEAKMRTTEPYGSPPALLSEEVEVVLTPTWANGGQVYIRQSDPLPLTVAALTLDVTIGG